MIKDNLLQNSSNDDDSSCGNCLLDVSNKDNCLIDALNNVSCSNDSLNCKDESNEGLSIYIHIPFCVSKCAYCAFYSEGFDSVLADRYANGLCKTIAFLASKKDKEVKTVYFGGGTPTVSGSDKLCLILKAIKENFKLAENCEVTFETNPKTISENDGLKLLGAGFNRVSLGFQTSNNDCLKTLGRIHTFEEAVSCYKMLERVGFNNISVDLMYALPNYSIQNTVNDIESILKLKPKHISTYALSIEEGTPLFDMKEEFRFADDDEQLSVYLEICRILKENGYEHYEVSNFCKNGYESKHNLGYWIRREYLGIGSGAHSFFNNKRFFVPDNRLLFIEATEKGDFLSATGLNNSVNVTETDAIEEKVMLSLRTCKGINLPSLSDKTEKLVKFGFANYEKGVFSLTDKGFFVSNTIIYQVLGELLNDR